MNCPPCTCFSLFVDSLCLWVSVVNFNCVFLASSVPTTFRGQGYERSAELSSFRSTANERQCTRMERVELPRNRRTWFRFASIGVNWRLAICKVARNFFTTGLSTHNRDQMAKFAIDVFRPGDRVCDFCPQEF